MSFLRLKRPTISSDLVIWVLTLYFGFGLNVRFWQFVFQHVQVTNFAVGWFVVSLPFFILMPLLLLFSLILWNKWGKGLIAFLLVASASAQYMMLRFGVMIDKHMMRNVFETNMREASDLITPSLLTVVFVTGVLPALLLLWTRVEYRPFHAELKRRSFWSLVSLGVLLFFAATTFKEYASFGRNHREMKKVINIFNYTQGTVAHVRRMRLAKRKFTVLDDKPNWEPLADAKQTVLVFVLGETARAANFSLYGYERETNPLLAKQDVIHFSEVMSCGTATAISVPCMFSHMLRSNFDVDDAQYTENLMDLLQKAGYDLYWFENDDGCKGVCDRIEKTQIMVRSKDNPYCYGKYCHDESMLQGVKNALETIAQNKKNAVIVMHTMGSHGPTYYQRYPDRFKKFTPTCDTADIQNCSREQIVNTYDNTILYTDFIVSSVIDLMKEHPSFEGGVLYVSDHGESLGENNIYLHGMPYAFAPDGQTQVPMVLYMNDTMKKLDYIDTECLKKEAKSQTFSHDNLFHSVTGLLELNTTAYDKRYDLFNKCRTKRLPFE